MKQNLLGTVLASLAFLLAFALFPNLWLLERLGPDNAAWLGLMKLVSAIGAAWWVSWRWSRRQS